MAAKKTAPKMSNRKFYKVTYKVTLLSEEPLPDTMDLAGIAYQMDEGECVGQVEQLPTKTVNALQVVGLLEDLGSEGSFFRLDNKGCDTDL